MRDRHPTVHEKSPRKKRASAHAAASAAIVSRSDASFSSENPASQGKRSSKTPVSNKKSVSKQAAKAKILPYTDIDLSRWREYGHIETESLWLFQGRERKNGHQLDYHGNCVPQILTQLISRYTKPDEIILDLFLGSGTSAIEAANLGRCAVGVELQSDMAAYVRNKLDEQGKSSQTVVINGDSRCKVKTAPAIGRALRQFGCEQAQFLFLHPPYGDIIRFSESDARDLSRAASNEAFLDSFETVCRQGYEWLEPGRFAGLVIGDKYENGELVPLGFQCMERMNRAGFRTKSIIVKNISGNEKAKGRMNNLWRYRALAGGFYVFKHEYVFVFQKPGTVKRNKKDERV